MTDDDEDYDGDNDYDGGGDDEGKPSFNSST